MILIKITNDLWVNPKRVMSVEARTIDNGRGVKTFTELTLDSMARWKLDIPLSEVVNALTQE